MSSVKVFIITDTQEDFDLVAKNDCVVEHSPERLVNASQLDQYSRVDVWDRRTLSLELHEQGIEADIMELSDLV